MERIIQNTVEARSFHLVNGAFAHAWHRAATGLGKDATAHIFEAGTIPDTQNMQVPKGTELICITQNETSNGTSIPLKKIYELKKRYPRIPIVLDVVSSAPYPKIDFKKIDGIFFSVQKGFGIPAGLGVLAVCDTLVQKSIELRKKQKRIESYHDFESLLKKEAVFQTPETPNVLDIYLLSKVTTLMLEKGISVIRKETKQKEKILSSFFSKSTLGELSIKNKEARSQTVIVVNIHENKASHLIDALRKKGLVVGSGYKECKETQIRIANFPQHTVGDMYKLINALKIFEKKIGD